MEQKLLVRDSDNQLIHKLSQALKEQGIYEGADYYYVDDNFKLPFFKIPKDYKKETPSDPDVHYIFIDIDNNPPFGGNEEYTVQGNYLHEHLSSAHSASQLVKRIYTGEYVEVALILKDRQASCFLKNQGDPQKNVGLFMENIDYIFECLKNPRAGGHMHQVFALSAPYFLNYSLGEQQMFEGYSAYAVSSVFAEHPEYYILK